MSALVKCEWQLHHPALFCISEMFHERLGVCMCRDDTAFKEEINTCLKLTKPYCEVTAFQVINVP